jgi:hypothetical protein
MEFVVLFGENRGAAGSNPNWRDTLYSVLYVARQA